MQSPRVLVAGAGYLGMAFAEKMRGADVYLARRSSVTVPGFKTVVCDFTQPDTLRGLPEVDVVYYAVAADSSSDEAYERAYYLGLKNLVEHYSARAVRPAFFYCSSTSVYSANGGEECVEDSPLVTAGPSRFMTFGESLLLDSGLVAGVLRYGGIYGPGRSRFLARVRDKLEPLTPGLSQYMNRIHQTDAVQMVQFLFEGGHSGIFNGVDAEPSLRDEVVSFVAQSLGLSLDEYPTSNIPTRGHKRVLSHKIQKLGYRFAYPSYREGYLALLGEI